MSVHKKEENKPENSKESFRVRPHVQIPNDN